MEAGQAVVVHTSGLVIAGVVEEVIVETRVRVKVGHGVLVVDEAHVTRFDSLAVAQQSAARTQKVLKRYGG